MDLWGGSRQYSAPSVTQGFQKRQPELLLVAPPILGVKGYDGRRSCRLALFQDGRDQHLSHPGSVGKLS
jgi:hypothetical protein